MTNDRNTQRRNPDDPRRMLLSSAVGGILSGIARALAEWLLGQSGR